MAEKRRYREVTVLQAQRRVLQLVGATLRKMSPKERQLLRLCGGGGLITIDELLQHVSAAVKLKVKG